MKYNEQNGLVPRQVVRAVNSIMTTLDKNRTVKAYMDVDETDVAADPLVQYMDKKALQKAIDKAKKSMEAAAKELDFLEAARYRNEMYALQKILDTKK